jgi:hypothetical protein
MGAMFVFVLVFTAAGADHNSPCIADRILFTDRGEEMPVTS